MNILQREVTKTEMIDADFLTYKSESGQVGRTTKGMAWTKTLEDAEKKMKNYHDWKAVIDQDLLEDEAAREALRNEKVMATINLSFDCSLPPTALAPVHRQEEQILERDESDSVSSSHSKVVVKPSIAQPVDVQTAVPVEQHIRHQPIQQMPVQAQPSEGPAISISPEMMYVIAQIFNNHPQYKADRNRLKIENQQKAPKKEQFLKMNKKDLIKLQYERDGAKPGYLTDGSMIQKKNQLLYVAFRGRGGRTYYTRKKPAQVKEDFGELEYTDVTNRKRLAWEVEQDEET